MKPPDGGRLVPAGIIEEWAAKGLIPPLDGTSDLPWSGADSPATVNVTTRRRWQRNPNPDPVKVRTNRNNRKRGNRTSHDLAAYLGGRNVEALKLPHDVEACGARIQSKRLAQRPSLNAIVGLIEYIGVGPSLRALYWVGAGQRVSSGRVFLLLPELVGEHGWTPPDGAVVHAGRAYILELPVSAFRELRGVA